MRATIELFAQGGWNAVKIETVAERAGVHKTTIYRRWPTRGALIAAALTARPFRPQDSVVADTGSLRGDFALTIRDLHAAMAEPRTHAVLRRLSESAFDPELGAAITAFYEKQIADIVAILRAAIRRGELPRNAKPQIAATMFIGAIKLQALDTGTLPPRAWFTQLVDATIGAARG